MQCKQLPGRLSEAKLVMMATVHITNVINTHLLPIWPKATLITSSYCGNGEIQPPVSTLS